MEVRIVLFVLTLVVYAVRSENGFDAVFDKLLEDANAKMKSENMCEKGLKDFSVSTKLKVWIFPVTVHISASGGKVQNLCSLERYGDVVVSQTDKDTVTLSLGIDLNGPLEIDYNDLKVKATIFYKRNLGKLKLLIYRHSLEGQVTLYLPSKGACKATLNYVSVQQLGDIHVFLNNKESSKFDRIANNDINSLKNTVTSTLKSKIQNVLNSEDICKEFLSTGLTLQQILNL